MQEVGDEATGVPASDVNHKVQPVDINENSVPEAKEPESPANQEPGSGDSVITTTQTVVKNETSVTETPEAEDTTVTSTTKEESAKKLVASKAQKWDGLGLQADVMELLSSMKLYDLTDRQKETVRTVTLASDPVIAMESGTSLTSALVAKLSMMQQLDPESLEHQMLILAPARIAALHVTYFMRDLCDGKKLNVRGAVGGSPLGADVESLRTGPQIVVGTSGRIIDLLDRCLLNTSYFKFLVLENAGYMLLNWRYDVWYILKKLPADVRIVLLSDSPDQELIDSMNRLKAETAEEMEKQKPEHMMKPKPEWKPKHYIGPWTRSKDRKKTKAWIKGKTQKSAPETTDTSSEPKTPASDSTPDIRTAEPVATTEPAADQPAVVLASA